LIAEIERMQKLIIVDRDKRIVTQGAFNAAMAEIERLREELHDAGDGDTWRKACGRCEQEIERLRGERNEAREAARWLSHKLAIRMSETGWLDACREGCERWPWLEVSDE